MKIYTLSVVPESIGFCEFDEVPLNEDGTHVDDLALRKLLTDNTEAGGVAAVHMPDGTVLIRNGHTDEEARLVVNDGKCTLNLRPGFTLMGHYPEIAGKTLTDALARVEGLNRAVFTSETEPDARS